MNKLDRKLLEDKYCLLKAYPVKASMTLTLLHGRIMLALSSDIQTQMLALLAGSIRGKRKFMIMKEKLYL